MNEGSVLLDQVLLSVFGEENLPDRARRAVGTTGGRQVEAPRRQNQRGGERPNARERHVDAAGLRGVQFLLSRLQGAELLARHQRGSAKFLPKEFVTPARPDVVSVSLSPQRLDR